MIATASSSVLAFSITSRTTIEMARTVIFPAAIRYQGELAATCASLIAVKYKFDTDTLDKVTALVKELQDHITDWRNNPFDPHIVAEFIVGGIEKIVLTALDEERPLDVARITRGLAELLSIGFVAASSPRSAASNPRGREDP